MIVNIPYTENKQLLRNTLAYDSHIKELNFLESLGYNSFVAWEGGNE